MLNAQTVANMLWWWWRRRRWRRRKVYSGANAVEEEEEGVLLTVQKGRRSRGLSTRKTWPNAVDVSGRWA